jgi:phage terminase large subunit
VKQLAHSYNPRGGCREAFIARDPEILLSGPAGTGKSRALLERLLVMALKYPNMRGLIVRKTLASLGSTALVTWREHVAVEAIESGLMKYYGGSAEEPPQYRFTNGSKIMIGGMDKPTRIMSSEYDVAYVQEAIELSTTDWENITTRLRNGKVPYQILMADTNPDIPTHWLKVRCNLGNTKLIESRHTDNPTLYTTDGTLTERGTAYISKLDNLSGARKLRLKDGLWVASEGQIYEEWNPAVHLVNRCRVPKEWPRYRSIDFGYVNPFVWQNWAIDPDGSAYLVTEIYHTKKTVDEHAAMILKHVTDGRDVGRKGEWLEPKPRAIICDHDAESRARLSKCLGMSTIPANKAVTDGIQAVQLALRPRGNGKRGIYIMRDTLIHPRDPDLLDDKKPTCTAEELPGYVWDVGAGKKPKETPLKEDDHGCDGLRYFEMGRTAGRPRVRQLG